MGSTPEPPDLIDGSLSIDVLRYWLGIFDKVRQADDQTHYCIPDFLTFLEYNLRASYHAPAGRPGLMKDLRATG